MMRFYLIISAILLTQSLYYYSTVSVYTVHVTASQNRQQNTKQGSLEAIISLTNQAYSEYNRDKEQSHRLFAEATTKLESYIKKYETNPASLSYLRVLVRLGALYQNADNLDQARITFEQCQRHKAFNSPDATLRVIVDGRKIEESIANYVKAQLCFLTNCSNPSYKEAYEFIRIQGDSRGGELAPPFLIPDRKRQHRKSRLSPN